MNKYAIYYRGRNDKEFKFEAETPEMARIKAMEAALLAHDNQSEVYQSDCLLYTVKYGIYDSFYDFMFLSNMGNEPESVYISSATGW